MIGLYVTVPVACFRRGFAREFLETETVPPPATCYGFLLSLVGETDRHRHVGCRVSPAVVRREPQISTVLRTVWRLKHRDRSPGASGNMRPDFQQLLTGLELIVWLDSSAETGGGEPLEDRVAAALESPDSITRFGGLSLGESTHLVNDICRISDSFRNRQGESNAQTFLLSDRGRLTLPVWVDHVGSSGTRYVTGDLVELPAFAPPNAGQLPQISP